MIRSLALSVAALAMVACSNKRSTQSTGGEATPPPSATTSAADAHSKPAPSLKAVAREGSAIARAPSDDALYVADEDHDVVRVVPLPFDKAKLGKEVAVASRPAQVLALGDRVLVTVRDPGLLLIMKRDAEKGLVEAAKVKLPADAWGIAVTPDEKTAFVTSAWTHKVSGIDLASAKVVFTVDVAREPRAIVVRPDGASAYVTHLVGEAVTRLDDLGSPTPKVKSIDLPPAPARAPSGKTLDASLAYSAVLADDGRRLFIARHALGAIGQRLWDEPWFGTATVDILLTASDTPLLGKRSMGLPKATLDDFDARRRSKQMTSAADFIPFVQPRAMVYRKATKTILVAGEGNDRLVEVDALSVAPAMMPLHRYKLGGAYEKFVEIAAEGGAPTGIALSSDEETAFVWCRSTYDLAVVKLFKGDEAEPQGKPEEVEKAIREARVSIAHVADDTLPKEPAMGRRLFYNAIDKITSGGLACNGCHPEGRDDGHVWHEATFGDRSVFFGEPENTPVTLPSDVKGVPRQTPMLSGRLNAQGPYGWTAQNKDLAERLKEGFGLHRWSGDTTQPTINEFVSRAQYLITFLKKGGMPSPPKEERELTAEESKGKQIFMSEQARCSKCHDPSNGEYTDRQVYPLGRLPSPSGFEEEKKFEFKTPSLRHVGGTPPYFHDGHASTLEFLIDSNNDRMGKTNQLSKEERAALIAFLRTL